MSSTDGIDDKKSYYNSNLILNDNNTKSTETDEKSKKPDINDSADDKTKKDDIKPVSFFKMFTYSTATNKLMYFIGLLCAIVTGLTSPANSLIFGYLANAMITYVADLANENVTDAGESLLHSIMIFSLAYVGIGVIILLCSYISVMCFNYAAHAQILRIRGMFFRSIVHQDMEWYDVNQTGEVASRMNEDLSKMEEGLAEKVVMFAHYLVAFVGSIVLAFVKGWQLALVCLASLPVTFLSMGLVSIATSKLAKQELNVYALAGNVAEEAFSGIRTVKAFEGEYREVSTYKSKVVHARNLNIKRNLFSGLGFGLLWFFIYASYALAFWYGVGLVLNNYAGDEYYANYDPGTMITVFFAVMMGSMEIAQGSPYIEAFGIARGACAKVFKIIEQVPVINPIEPRGIALSEPLTHIEFRNLDFQYPTRKEVQILNKFNLKIHRGQTIALVGHSGCGKSTCIQLIQRFYDPQKGAVYFNNIDLKDININWLRDRIGVVGQEPILFATTIYENIRYGKEDATEKEIEEAARKANAHIFISKLPEGYHTLVGERGVQLSGGQKQRVAIARALIRDPEILLLDEATSALDTASEAKVQAALERASEGRTTIIVAHRLSTIRHADKIIVIEKGEVVEAGTHDELMEVKKHYFKLITTQLGNNSLIKTPGTEKSKSIWSAEDADEEEIIIIKDKDETIDKKEKDNPVSLLEIMKLNKTEWPQILCGCVSSVIIGLSMPIFAVLFGDILGIISVQDDPKYVRDNTNIYSLFFLIAGIVVGLATFLQQYTFGIAGEKLTERLRGSLFEAMLNQEVAWFDDKANGTGSLCARLSREASAVQGATGQRIGILMQSLATLILSVGLSMYYEWSLGLLAMAFAPFILAATYMQYKVMEKENMGTAKAMENCTKLAVEVVSNIKTVASLGKEEMFHEKYTEMLSPAIAKAKKNTHIRGFVFGLARSLMFFAYAACMYYGAWCVVNKGMNFADVFKVAEALIMGTFSVGGALAFAPNLQKGINAAKNIFKLFNREPKIIDSPNVSRDPWHCAGNVSFDNVKFTYPTRPEITVLNDLMLRIQKGQKIALVGPSGCGKSTCIQLIQRFYDVDGGSVSIDSNDVRNLALGNLRKQLGIVSQEPILFDRTICENIAYGDNSRFVSEQEVIDAAKKANIHNFVASLPLGYETRMGEKGTQLSGGQKQRIAIARALVRNPKILLLDEATSALDAESEKVVQDALEAASEGRTTISIAHRLSTITDSDVIFVIDGGKVIASGTHQQLLEMHGLYYDLYKLQAGTM